MLGDICDLDDRPNEDRGITPRIFEYLFSRIQKVIRLAHSSLWVLSPLHSCTNHHVKVVEPVKAQQRGVLLMVSPLGYAWAPCSMLASLNRSLRLSKGPSRGHACITGEIDIVVADLIWENAGRTSPAIGAAKICLQVFFSGNLQWADYRSLGAFLIKSSSMFFPFREFNMLGTVEFCTWSSLAVLLFRVVPKYVLCGRAKQNLHLNFGTYSH